MRSLRGFLFLIMLFVCSVVCSSGNSSSSTPPGTRVPNEVIIATQQWFIEQQTRAVSSASTSVPITRPNLITQDPIVATEMQLTRSAYSIPRTETPFPNSTVTPSLDSVGVLSGTVYAQGSVNVRECPRRDCEFVGALSDGQSVQVTGATNGDAVVAGDPLWFRVLFGGREAYVYAQYTTDLGPDTGVFDQAPHTVTFDEPSYIRAIESKLGLRNILSVRVADGRSNGGQRVAIIAYNTSAAYEPNFVNEWIGFYTDVASAIKEYQLDIDIVVIVIGLAPDITLGTLDASVPDLLAYYNGQMDRDVFATRIHFTPF